MTPQSEPWFQWGHDVRPLWYWTILHRKIRTSLPCCQPCANHLKLLTPLDLNRQGELAHLGACSCCTCFGVSHKMNINGWFGVPHIFGNIKLIIWVKIGRPSPTMIDHVLFVEQHEYHMCGSVRAQTFTHTHFVASAHVLYPWNTLKHPLSPHSAFVMVAKCLLFPAMLPPYGHRRNEHRSGLLALTPW